MTPGTFPTFLALKFCFPARASDLQQDLGIPFDSAGEHR
jgi:hypothetical protein